MVLAGLVAALNLVGGSLSDHKFLFLGAGEVSPYNSGTMSPSSLVLGEGSINHLMTEK